MWCSLDPTITTGSSCFFKYVATQLRMEKNLGTCSSLDLAIVVFSLSQELIWPCTCLQGGDLQLFLGSPKSCSEVAFVGF